MTRASKLYPSAIQAQCQSAIAILQADNEKLLTTSASVSAFVEDKEIISVSFDQLKLQCSNYVDAINSIIEVNNMDIADYQTLSSAVGSENLEGDVIITNQEKYARLRDEAYERESIYRSQAASDMDAGLKALHYAMAEFCHYQGDFYEERYQYWVEKEVLYDSIESSTSGLFTGSGAMRSALISLLVGLSESFHLNTGYNPSGMTVIKHQIARIKQGEIDFANGMKAFEEYLDESGRFTIEERNAIIERIKSQAPKERILALSNIISVAGDEAGNVNIEEMIALYGRYSEEYSYTNRDGETVTFTWTIGNEEFLNYKSLTQKEITDICQEKNPELVNRGFDIAIYEISQEKQINPKAILATLAQEQRWCLDGGYDKAFGVGMGGNPTSFDSNKQGGLGKAVDTYLHWFEDGKEKGDKLPELVVNKDSSSYAESKAELKDNFEDWKRKNSQYISYMEEGTQITPVNAAMYAKLKYTPWTDFPPANSRPLATWHELFRSF